MNDGRAAGRVYGHQKHLGRNSPLISVVSEAHDGSHSWRFPMPYLTAFTQHRHMEHTMTGIVLFVAMGALYFIGCMLLGGSRR